jgi:hypothetical protein
MNKLKNLKFILLALILLLILVIVRNSDRNIFRSDVKTAIDVVQNNSNLLSPEQLHQLKSPDLLINLGDSDLPDSLHVENSIRIPFENLLDGVNRKILNEVKGDLVLYSADVATASKAWIILNQLGFKNVKILSTEKLPEQLKYKFQPDKTARLELDSI